MTKDQADEIRYAIVKGRQHLEAKIRSQAPTIAQRATGSGAASSSGQQLPNTPRRSPSRNPPVRNPMLNIAPGVPSPRTPLGNPAVTRGAAPAVTRGAANRVCSDRNDPFALVVQRHRDEQARAAPSFGQNPNVDFRLMDQSALGNPIPPLRDASPIEMPPGEWVSGRLRDAAAARAAAAALPYADDRSTNRQALAAARARPIVPAERRQASPVRYAERERSLPPRREAARRSPSRTIVHPENPRLVWSLLENKRIFRSQDDSKYRGARSRSPPRQVRDPREDFYRKTWRLII